MDGYGRLFRWIVAAKNAKGFKRHPLHNTIVQISQRLQDHQSSISATQDPASVRKFIRQHLLEDSSLALIVIQFVLDPDSLQPKDSKTDLKEWSTPQTAFELDHQGGFTEIANEAYLYGGAESKFNYACTKSVPERLLTMIAWRAGRSQLESRIRLIDGVMNLGFEAHCLYSVRLYVPMISVETAKGVDQGRTLVVRRSAQDSPHISTRCSADASVQTMIDMKRMNVLIRREHIAIKTSQENKSQLVETSRRQRGQSDTGVVDRRVTDVKGEGDGTDVTTEADTRSVDAVEGHEAAIGERVDTDGGNNATTADDNEHLPELIPVKIKYTLKVYSFD